MPFIILFSTAAVESAGAAVGAYLGYLFAKKMFGDDDE